MPRFQLEVAIVLAIGAIFSSLIFYLSQPEEGKIALPTELDLEEETEPDPFDVITPEDVIEGYPIDEDIFWDNVRFRKLALSFIFVVTAAIEAVCIGWSAANDDTRNLIIFTLRLAFSLYLLLLAVRSTSQVSTEPHSRSVVHLSVLTILAAALLGETAIFPSTPSPVASTLESSPFPSGLWHTSLVLYALACIIAITTPRGPAFHYPPGQIYSKKTVSLITNTDEDNVCGMSSASTWGSLLFSYTTKVVWLGNTSASLEIGDLPITPASMRATFNFRKITMTMKTVKLRIREWSPKSGSGWELIYHLARTNWVVLTAQITLAAFNAVIYYVPALFLRWIIQYLEVDPQRKETGWGWVYAAGLFSSNAILYLSTGQLWSLAVSTLQPRLKMQMNSVLFAKTLVRKDVASSSGSSSGSVDEANQPNGLNGEAPDKKGDEEEFSSKAQVMTLMTTDVDRVSEISWHLFSLIDSPIEVIIGTVFLYNLLGISCFYGLAITCLFLPMNHYAGKVVIVAQDNLMKARDERVGLMNEILGGIRMLKFMAWERNFEAKVMKVRDKELKYQRLNYMIAIAFNTIWSATPILVQLISFWHYTVIRRQILTPSTAFTAISVFAEMKFALNALPETFINMFQSLVSLRRIEKYLHSAEVSAVPPLGLHPQTIALQSATVTWPQERRQASSTPSRPSSAISTPKHKFILMDLTLNFPMGKLSLVCGKLGSGKTLLLLALLGEADLLTGQVICPRSPPDSLASFAGVHVPEERWIVDGICAYVPQAAWLRNASIKENILFSLPLDEKRYQRTLEVCALVSDLKILEDGDESEIGERGVNLSGGQKARVSLARAVYSRASLLILDDVLSAVDAHTAHHLYYECLQGDLMRGRTVILVSHHVQLCAPGAEYIVALDNGRVQFQGDREDFRSSGLMSRLVQSSGEGDPSDDKEDAAPAVVSELSSEKNSDPGSQASSFPGTPLSGVKTEYKAPRKLVEEEKRAVGRIGREIWETYVEACGNVWYWAIFSSLLFVGAFIPVLEYGWLKHWSGSLQRGDDEKGPLYYITIYTIITGIGLLIMSMRWLALYTGSLHASEVLYKRLLEGVLFANIRFHDTTSRGRLLNRFGKDIEGIDSSLSDNFGRSLMYGISALTTFITISIVGGLPFVLAAFLVGILYYNVAKIYGQTSRDMRRLDSVTRSPLYSIYGETISGVALLRAFGASSKFLRDMLRCVDTNICPYFWMWGVNRWLSIRFNLLSCVVIGVTASIIVLSSGIDASLAGFMLAFASTVTSDLLFLVRRFVSLEQSMVALERVKEYSEIAREPPEFIEPRPPASWPSCGSICCEGLVVRYAPDLPDVLHSLNFTIQPGEKVGILGRTGSGKSTLALSLFRFVEPTEGRILVDDVDIATIGLSDLRNRLTIIPQDPTILSGSVRSTLDVFDEYQDVEIFEALRRVHLIPSEEPSEEAVGEINENPFRNLDSPVSEGGENFSTGEKQLLCMARAILKRSKVLVMDEATASVDYATDELISKTIRQEFAESTILTIAHRLRTIIDYDRVMLLEEGHIVELDRPGVLLSNSRSKFYALCKATGKAEFSTLKKLAGV